MRGLNLAFATFTFSQILWLFKALKNRLNLESKFKVLRLIFFTVNFINLLKNFTRKFIKFTKKTLGRKLKFGFFKSIKQVYFPSSQKATNLSVIMAAKDAYLQHGSNNKFAGQVYGIFGIAAFVCIPSCVKFDLKELK
ncbi:hypothetical protein [uncultured Campylobacter sp.]|uniref:hypothetical protein n=1 Tax=uncultured Campylobacter sp. TaxID=218934 RepID=UPI00261CD8D8|nr:hypothetical protein [uncultured Campylobacter sp.]